MPVESLRVVISSRLDWVALLGDRGQVRGRLDCRHRPAAACRTLWLHDRRHGTAGLKARGPSTPPFSATPASSTTCATSEPFTLRCLQRWC